MKKLDNQLTIQLNIKNNLGQNIVGILERKSLNNTFGAKLGIICHGFSGHKNYLFQTKLSKELPFDNFRFDFRGNGESDGLPKFFKLQDDVEDIDTVVRYLESEFGYKLYAAIGHSKGSNSILLYACYVNRNIPHIINLSPRYYLPAILSKMENSKVDLLMKQGYAYWEDKSGVGIKITLEELYFDNSFVSNMPETTTVLTCHGIADEVIPVKDAADYANLIPNHIIKLIPRADHNYSNQHETLIKTINKYFSDDFQYMKFNDKYLYRIPRYIFIGGVKNFRDLGGYECNLGEQNNRIQQFVRERFVFRCGNLTSITNDGIATLRKLNIQKIFDLRSNPEVNKMGIKNIEGIIRVHAPVFKEEDYSPEKLFERWNLYIKGVEGYSQAYMTILEEGKKAYYEIFKHILEHQAQPFIVHCTAGKDRTGVFAMLLLKLLGVNDEIISREYELTQIIKDPQKIKFIIKTMNNKYEDDGIKEMLNAKYESMILFLRKFQNHYNTVDNYLLQCGFTKEDIEIIKNNLVCINNVQSFKSNNLIRSSL